MITSVDINNEGLHSKERCHHNNRSFVLAALSAELAHISWWHRAAGIALSPSGANIFFISAVATTAIAWRRSSSDRQPVSMGRRQCLC